MGRFFRIAVLVIVFCCYFFQYDTAHAANNTAWFENTISSTSVRYSDESGRGQCTGMTVMAYNYATQSIVPMHPCVTYTSWGSMTRSGYVRFGSLQTYYKLAVSDGTTLLPAPDSNRLYVAQMTEPGYFRIGYITNPQGALSFDTLTHTYRLPQFITYLSGTYSLASFSNNSEYLIGLTADGNLERVALRNNSVASISLASFGVNIGPIRLMTISEDGSLVLATDTRSAVVLDFDECARRGGECPTRTLTNTLSGLSEGLDSVFIGNDRRELSIFSSPRDGNITRLYFSVVNPLRYVSYVALGDSYSSGEGTWNYEAGTDGNEQYPQEKCHQSYSESYAGFYGGKYGNGPAPALMAFSESQDTEGMRIGSFILVACSGAKAGDVWQETVLAQDSYRGNFDQFTNTLGMDVKRALRSNAVENKIPGRALQRDFLAYYQPNIATIGIGGNDVDFGGVIKACLSLSTCPQASSKRAESGKLIQSKFDVLVKTFEDLHTASPSTRLYAVGYPLFVTDDSWLCGVNTVLDRTERTFIKESVRYLNDVIEAAAKKAGIGYIDIENSLGNGVLCGGGTGAVNGISLGDDIAVPNTSIKVGAQESFHPNSYGYDLVAGAMVDIYGELDTYPNRNCLNVQSGYCPSASTGAPAVPAYFGTSNRSVVDTKNIVDSLIVTRLIKLFIDGLKPTSLLSGSIYSEQRSLGTFTVGLDGIFDRTIQLPANLEAGYHTIYFSGTLENGESFEYSQVILYAPADTRTGPCGILPYSNIDQDADGIDDACDPFIDVEDPIVADPSTILIYPNQESAIITETNQETISSNEAGGSKAASTTSIQDTNNSAHTVNNQLEAVVNTHEERMLDQTIRNNSVNTLSSSTWRTLLVWSGVLVAVVVCVMTVVLAYRRYGKGTK